MKRLALLVVCLVAVVTPPAPAQDKRPMKVDDLFRFQRVSDPQISPNGKAVVYAVSVVDLPGNRSASHLWLAAADGSWRRQLTTALGKKDRSPRWSPDGKHILFESNRSGDNQLWVITVDQGGEARQLTNVATGASNGTWSPDGKMIAFVSAVWPEYSDKPFKESNELNRKRAEEIEKSPVKAKVFTKLFYRHWDEYVGDKRQHLFVVPLDGSAEPRDVTLGDRDAFPTSTTFSSSVDFTFTPDGKYLVYTAPPERDEAWSTNYDIWRVALDGKSKPENLTEGNAAADSGPQFSPDGKKLTYRAQKKPGYEADRWGLMIVNVNPDGTFAGKPVPYTHDAVFPEPPGNFFGKKPLRMPFDRSVNEFVWKTNKEIWFSADWAGSTRVYAADPAFPGFGHYTHLHANGDGSVVGSYGSLTAAKDGTVAFTHATMSRPAEVFVTGKPKWDGTGKPSLEDLAIPNINLSHANDALLAELALPRPEQADIGIDQLVHMWILKPPGFDPKKKWPLAYLVHGGPQGAWADGWSYRWNPQLWAAQGYVVALPNPRGSTGFGQKYVDEISGDWGGKCYDDLMKGLDYLEKLPYIDRDRMAAAGASFGGYMMNWFAVNTDRFKCLITHCSVWNFESMYATTDELWFDEWEHGGPPWGKNRHSYEKHSPHRYAANLTKFKTPMLVIHNDLDFRCPIGQGHELFGSLQRQGVPSRMINFPDEGHWVLKPKNSEYWHKEVFAWLTKYTAPGGR